MEHTLDQPPALEGGEVEAVEDIKFKDDKEKKRLIGALVDSIEQDLKDREPLEETAKIAVAQYHSMLEPEEKNKGTDSEIDVPSTRQFCEGGAARLINPFMQYEEVWASKARRATKEAYDFSKGVDEFTDYITDRAEFRKHLEMSLRQAEVFPKVTVKYGFTHEVETVDAYYWDRDKGGGVLETQWEAKADVTTGKYKTKPKRVTVRAGCFPEVIPWADSIHPMGVSDLKSSPRWTHRTWLTKEQIQARIEEGIYDEKDYEDQEPILERLGDPDSKPDPELELSEPGKERQEIADKGKLFEVLESWTTLGGMESVITVERASRCVFRAKKNWFHEYKRPAVTWSYEEVLNNVDGISLCFQLEPGHRAISAILNQRLDAASRALSKMVFISRRCGAEKYFDDNNKPRDGVFIVDSIAKLRDDIYELDLSSGFQQIQTLEQDIRRDQEKLAGLNPYNFGQEQIERPTATGQVALINEGNQPLFNRLESFRAFLKDGLLMQLSRYRQYYPTGIKYYVQSDPKNQELTEKVLKWPAEFWRDQIIVETYASSQRINKELRKQEWLALVQAVPQVLDNLLKYMEIASQPGPLAPVAAKFVTWYLNFVIQPWMHEFSVLGKEFLDVTQDLQVGQMFTEIIEGLQQQLGMAQQQGAELEAKLGEVTGQLNSLAEHYLRTTGEVPPIPERDAGQAEALPPMEGAPPGAGEMAPPTGPGGGGF